MGYCTVEGIVWTCSTHQLNFCDLGRNYTNMACWTVLIQFDDFPIKSLFCWLRFCFSPLSSRQLGCHGCPMPSDLNVFAWRIHRTLKHVHPPSQISWYGSRLLLTSTFWGEKTLIHAPQTILCCILYRVDASFLCICQAGSSIICVFQPCLLR